MHTILTTSIVCETHTKENKMTTTFETAKVGDKVWCMRFGWGEIRNTEASTAYPIAVYFPEDEFETYTAGGLYDEDDITQSIFWDEVVIEAPVKPIPVLQVDTKVLVWNDDDDNVKHRCYFSHFGVDGKISTFHSGQTSWSTNKTAPWANWELAE